MFPDEQRRKIMNFAYGRKPGENQKERVLFTADDGLFSANALGKRNQRIDGPALLVKQAMTVKV